MDRTLLIFGVGDVAELADFYFTQDHERRSHAFVLDGEYIKEDEFLGRPVIATEEVQRLYNAEEADLFVALAYTHMNKLRSERLAWARKAGFGLISYVSPRATIFSNVVIGRNCFILEDNTIQPFVRIGDNVTLWSGNHIGHHSAIEDDVFIASHVVVSGGVTVGRGSFIGVNATLRDHILIGEETLIGAGAVILKDTDPHSVYATARTRPRDASSNSVTRI